MTKNNSLAIKGVAIILMINHHLFAFPGRVKEYESVYKFNSIPIEFYLGEISKICVSIFLFLGGYALYKVYKESVSYRSILKRVYKLYLNYWSVFIVFITLGILLGKIGFNFRVLFSNFIGISSSLNGEWWFFIIYVLLIAMYPIIRHAILKYNSVIVFLASFIIFCIGTLANIVSYRIGLVKYEIIFNIMNCQYMFVLGALTAKEAIFDKAYKFINKRYQSTTIILFGIIFLLIFPIKTLGYALITLVFIFALNNTIGKNKILIYLGRHSMNMWLIHTFFCYYYFQEIVFMPRYSILILLWTILLSLTSSVIIEKMKYYLGFVITNISPRQNNIIESGV